MRTLGLTLVVVALLGVIAATWIATRGANAAPSAASRSTTAVEDSTAPHELAHPLARHTEERDLAQTTTNAAEAPREPRELLEPLERGTRAADDRERAERRFEAHVRGSVRDTTSERPIPGVTVRFHDATRVVAQLTTPEDGHFELRFAAVWPVRVEVDAADAWTVTSGAGELDARTLQGARWLDIGLERRVTHVAGDIHGYLLSESGAWTPQTLPKPRAVLVDLVPTREPRVPIRGEITPIVDVEDRATVEFRFTDVAPGEYELTLSALDGFRWEPKSLRVSPPADGLTFVRYDKDRTLPLVFEVFDAQTREPVKDFEARSVKLTPSEHNGVFLHAGPIELGRYALHEPFEWVVSADGYGPAFGDESAFVLHPDKRVARVELTRDWATRVVALIRDPAARLAAGAEVLVAGRSVGRTNAGGSLVVRSPEPPSRIEVRVPGFRQIPGTDPLGGRGGDPQRNRLLIVYLEPVR